MREGVSSSGWAGHVLPARVSSFKTYNAAPPLKAPRSSLSEMTSSLEHNLGNRNKECQEIIVPLWLLNFSHLSVFVKKNYNKYLN